MKNISQRIKIVADNENIKITQLESKIGASKGVLSRSLNNNTDIQSKWITSIVENYPQYDAEWLLTGKGEMMKKETDNDSKHDSSPCNLCAEKDKLIASLNREIDTLTQQKEDLRKAVGFLRDQIDCNDKPKTKQRSA